MPAKAKPDDPSCTFCRIASGDIPAKLALEHEDVVAFADLNPQRKFHFLVIPRRHVARLSDLREADAALAGRLVLAAAELARRESFSDSGYRLVMNCNEDGGQSVFHVHLHLLGGGKMGWPPFPH